MNSQTYELMKQLINQGKTDADTMQKLDDFYACGRITKSQRDELHMMIDPDWTPIDESSDIQEVIDILEGRVE